MVDPRVETEMPFQGVKSSGTDWPPEPFTPIPWLHGPHRQTLLGALLPRRFSLPAAQERFFQVEKDVRILCRCHWQTTPQSATTMILVHGFEGSASSGYMLGTAEKAWMAGMNVVRVNIRNCGRTEHLGPTFYHSGLSSDLKVVLQELIEHDRLPSIVMIGFSLGGNQVLKLTGELGAGAPAQLRAVAAVSPGVDLLASSRVLHRWQNRLYEWNFLLCLRRTLQRKARFFPELCAPYRNR